MYEDLLKDTKETAYGSKGVTENEFKVLFCSICDYYEKCQFNALEECIKEFTEG